MDSECQNTSARLPSSPTGDDLVQACADNQYTLVETLMSYDYSHYPSGRRGRAFYTACALGHIDIVRLLIKNNYHSTICRFHNSLAAAVNNNHIDVVAELLPVVTSSVVKNQAFNSAMRCGQIEIIKLLLTDNDVNPLYKQTSGIIMAYTNGHIEAIKIILKDSRVSISNYGVLFNLIYHTKREVLLVLARISNDVNNAFTRYPLKKRFDVILNNYK